MINVHKCVAGEQSTIPGPNAYSYGERVTTKGSQNTPMYSLQSRHSNKGKTQKHTLGTNPQ